MLLAHLLSSHHQTIDLCPLTFLFYNLPLVIPKKMKSPNRNWAKFEQWPK